MPGTLEDYAFAVGNLISTCRDAEQGFRAAADAVKQPALKEMFEHYSEQRGHFATELQEAVKSMGFDTSHPSGVGGVVHGAWMAIKGVLTGHNEGAILIETERGEDWSLKAYRDALEINLPVSIRSIIEQQYEQVRDAQQHIKLLREAVEPKEPPPTAPPSVMSGEETLPAGALQPVPAGTSEPS